MDKINNIKWGGSGIEKVLYEFILDRVPTGSVVVELGGGNCSTKALGRNYRLYTIEHNEHFLQHTDYTTYLYAPINNGWYDREYLVEKIPDDISMVFVDGPSGNGHWLRTGLLDNLDLFGNLDSTIFIVHDTWRDQDLNLAKDLAEKLNREVIFFQQGSPKDYWALVK